MKNKRIKLYFRATFVAREKRHNSPEVRQAARQLPSRGSAILPFPSVFSIVLLTESSTPVEFFWLKRRMNIVIEA